MSAEQDEVRFAIPERPQESPEFLERLQKEHHSFLWTMLISRGATQAEADELLQNMWGDCVGQDDNRPSLLEKYNGKGAIRGWLKRVVINRLIDLKRHKAHEGELPHVDSDDADSNPFERVPATASAQSENALLNLLKETLQAAFAKCPADGMMMLRLVHVHELTQREIAHMWGWTEFKVSRYLTKAMENIQADALGELKKRDPWLQLSWDDFVELCETHQIDFL